MGFDIGNPDEDAAKLVPIIHEEVPVIGIDFQISEVMSVDNLLALPVPVARQLHAKLGAALKEQSSLVRTSQMPSGENGNGKT
jgi:hypothetical protein